MSLILIPGVCRECGCTAERACAGGCWWVDDDRTLCSACAAAIAAEPCEPIGLGELGADDAGVFDPSGLP